MEQIRAFADVLKVIDKKHRKWQKTGRRRGKGGFAEKKGIDLFQIVCYNAENEHGASGKISFCGCAVFNRCVAIGQ